MEEEEGNFALWMSYILTGAGANLISWLVLPTSSVSLGASGAVFGLFTISVLVKVINSIFSYFKISYLTRQNQPANVLLLKCFLYISWQMSWDWRKIIEVLILGQFVVDKVPP